MTTLIFPMAGQGARFGYAFKPFLEIDGGTFIEAAFAPFRPHLGRIERVLFIFLEAQEQAEDVTARLATMFAGVPHAAIRLDHPTRGPAETLACGLAGQDVTGSIMVCDCDHALDVGPLFAASADPKVTCALPTWDMTGEPLTSWGVAGIDGDRVVAIAEKALPDRGKAFRGVIGCYYFSDVGAVRERLQDGRNAYLSDVVRDRIAAGDRVVSVPVTAARFFGDPARLARATR